MERRIVHRMIVGLMLTVVVSGVARAQGETVGDAAVALSETLGDEIDATEREPYNLFPAIDGFVSARFTENAGGSYRLFVTTGDVVGEVVRQVRLSSEMFETTRLHVELVESYNQRSGRPIGGPEVEAESQYRVALRYAARGDYAMSRAAIEDLFSDYPSSTVAADALDARDAIDRLSRAKRALFLPVSLYDRSGRTGLLIFAGYYGLWAGLATPVALNSESEDAIALGMILGAPAGIVTAHLLTKNADMSKGRASLIELGGDFGTWQGIGWAATGDADGEAVVGIGLLSGLAGIGIATIATRNVHITEGHGALSGNALGWGSWFGLVAGEGIADLDDEELLRAVLIGGDVLVAGTLIGARDAQMSQGRVRLISLMGVAGAFVGSGVAVLANVDDEGDWLRLAGAGSLGGLALGFTVTDGFDRGKNLSGMTNTRGNARWAMTAGVELRRDPFHSKKQMPTFAMRLRF